MRDKTGGNPFFVIQFLTALHRQGLIAFDGDARAWRWDLARIRAQGYTDNVVELMVSKLRDLPPETQEALSARRRASAPASKPTRSPSSSDAIPTRAAAGGRRRSAAPDRTTPIASAHDRVQEAAYSLIPEAERAAMHLRIGRLLLEHTPPAELEEKIFDIVNQLNFGAALVTPREERDRSPS